MKIKSFSIKNFRSISEANIKNINELLIFIWKNNEWKSNILKWLKVSLECISISWRYSTVRAAHRRSKIYDWESDFPVKYQSRSRWLNTIFKIEFELNESEIQDFKLHTWSKINWVLKVEIKIWKDSRPNIKFIKKWQSNKTWENAFSQKQRKICKYIANNIHFNYIPAIRTDEQAIEEVKQLVSDQLSSVENNPEYIEALNTINRLQSPIKIDLENKIKDSLKWFIPEISSVEINMPQAEVRYSLRSTFDIYIDDWSRTLLSSKWDWVKSLATLGLLKDSNKSEWISLIAIEEPEAHLHPWAIHWVKEVLSILSQDRQVIISTHNPIFIDNLNLSNNYIVSEWSVKKVSKISEIRSVLWVKVSDNLSQSSFVLLVEWEDDRISLESILTHKSEIIKRAITNRALNIIWIGWASKLTSELYRYQHLMCTTYSYLDNDEAWIKAKEQALKEWTLSESNYNLTICNWMQESEFEDCLNSNIYKDVILEKFGVNCDVGEFKSNKKRSIRMKDVFCSQWKDFNDRTKSNVKLEIAYKVKEDPSNSLCKYKWSSIINGLIPNLERIINKLPQT
jgi:predicted ATP-dependent endonuclease of OLD family